MIRCSDWSCFPIIVNRKSTYEVGRGDNGWIVQSFNDLFIFVGHIINDDAVRYTIRATNIITIVIRRYSNGRRHIIGPTIE